MGKTLKYDFTLSTIIYGFSMSGCILWSAFVYKISWVFINIINKTAKPKNYGFTQRSDMRLLYTQVLLEIRRIFKALVTHGTEI